MIILSCRWNSGECVWRAVRPDRYADDGSRKAMDHAWDVSGQARFDETRKVLEVLMQHM
jgi:hypothetical protein